MRLLLLAFFVVPLAELYLLIWISRWVGFVPTLALTLATALVGGGLAKREGLDLYRRWRAALERLEPPPVGLIDGALVLVGAAFLMTPGLLTDLAGVCLLIPATRERLARLVRARIERQMALRGLVFHRAATKAPGVIDTTGEASE